MIRVYIDFATKADFHRFLRNPGSLRLKDVRTEDTTLTRERFSSPLVLAMVRHARDRQTVTTSELVSHALKATGTKRTDKSLRRCYRAVARLADKGLIRKVRTGVYVST